MLLGISEQLLPTVNLVFQARNVVVLLINDGGCPGFVHVRVLEPLMFMSQASQLTLQLADAGSVLQGNLLEMTHFSRKGSLVPLEITNMSLFSYLVVIHDGIRKFIFAICAAACFLPACSTISLNEIVALPVLLVFCLKINALHVELSFSVSLLPFLPILNVTNRAICRNDFSRCSAVSSRGVSAHCVHCHADLGDAPCLASATMSRARVDGSAIC